MKRGIFAVFLLLLCTASFSFATPVQLDGGTYNASNTIAELDRVSLSHNRFYSWGIEDLDVPAGTQLRSLDIVFHNIYDDSGEENLLNLYIFNGPVALGYDDIGRDESDDSLPIWKNIYPTAELVGTWEYDHDLYTSGERFDVVFTVTDETLLSYLIDGGTWGLGFDPDCHFRATGVSVVAPVPEPQTLILLGMGLLGLAGITRKKINL